MKRVDYKNYKKKVECKKCGLYEHDEQYQMCWYCSTGHPKTNINK